MIKTKQELLNHFSDINEMYNNPFMYQTLSNMIDELLEQQPKAEWIPVNERLPEKAGKYLVTVKNGNVYAVVYDAFSGQFQCAATAWMPLPEPYKESEEEE